VLVLCGDAIPVTSCDISLLSIPSCCPVREKLARGGTFVSYLLAVGELDRVAGVKSSRVLERLPVQSPLTHNPSNGAELQVLRPPIRNCGCLSCCRIHPLAVTAT
jgi:hypothetical protein